MFIESKRNEFRGAVAFSSLLLLAITFLMVSCNKRESTSAAPKQKTFASPEAAGQALFEAANAEAAAERLHASFLPNRVPNCVDLAVGSYSHRGFAGKLYLSKSG